MIEHKKALVKLAAYYEKILTDEQIEIYSKQLFEYLTIEQLSKACKVYIDNPKNEFFPRPISKLIAIVSNPYESIDFAVEISSRVIESVSKFGWTGEFKARQHVGDHGWLAIERLGGWQYLCENLGVTLNLTTTQAQIREMIKSNLEISKIQARNGTYPQIEQKQSNLIEFKDLIKEIPK